MILNCTSHILKNMPDEAIKYDSSSLELGAGMG